MTAVYPLWFMVNCTFKLKSHSEVQFRNKTFYSYNRAVCTFGTWRDSTIAFIKSDFKVVHKPPPSPPPSLTMSLLPVWWATGSANCTVWCNNHIQLRRMGSDMWNHNTHTHTCSLTHSHIMMQHTQNYKAALLMHAWMHVFWATEI